jgi:hypothetical protein
MYYLRNFDRMIHFNYAISTTFSIFVFKNLSGDDLAGQAENFSQLGIVHFVFQLVERI